MVVIHVVVKKERQQVIKQEKKLTTNNIFLCDNKGQMIAMGSPKAGNHNDLYKIEEVLKEILALLEEAGIEHKGLFLNADAGFDSKSLREFLESKEIIANIKPNPRNLKRQNQMLKKIAVCPPTFGGKTTLKKRGVLG